MASEKILRAPSSRAAAVATSTLREREREAAAAAAAAAAAKRARKPPVYVFPSSLKVNSLRAEALFRLLPQSSQSSSPAPSPYADETNTFFAPDYPESVGDDGRSSTPVQGPRRSTRSTGDQKEEWIRIPVEASVRVEGTDPRTLDGFVYLSSETLQLYKKWGLVFFETTLEGACYNFQVPEEQLPMLTTEHPLYVAELAKIEKSRSRKLRVISELLKLSRSNVDVHHEMEVLTIEHSHSKDLLALKIQMQANLVATVGQSQECNPPAPPTTLDHQRFALQQPLFAGEHKTQDLPVGPSPVAGPVATTRVVPVLEQVGANRRRADSCNFDDALFPTTLPAVTTATTTTVKAVNRKRSRHDNRKRVTGAGDNFEEDSGERNSSRDSGDEDNDEGYLDIVDFFQARLLQKGPVARPVACKGPRIRQKIASS